MKVCAPQALVHLWGGCSEKKLQNSHNSYWCFIGELVKGRLDKRLQTFWCEERHSSHTSDDIMRKKWRQTKPKNNRDKQQAVRVSAVQVSSSFHRH